MILQTNSKLLRKSKDQKRMIGNYINQVAERHLTQSASTLDEQLPADIGSRLDTILHLTCMSSAAVDYDTHR